MQKIVALGYFDSKEVEYTAELFDLSTLMTKETEGKLTNPIYQIYSFNSKDSPARIKTTFREYKDPLSNLGEKITIRTSEVVAVDTTSVAFKELFDAGIKLTHIAGKGYFLDVVYFSPRVLELKRGSTPDLGVWLSQATPVSVLGDERKMTTYMGVTASNETITIQFLGDDETIISNFLIGSGTQRMVGSLLKIDDKTVDELAKRIFGDR